MDSFFNYKKEKEPLGGRGSFWGGLNNLLFLSTYLQYLDSRFCKKVLNILENYKKVEGRYFKFLS